MRVQAPSTSAAARACAWSPSSTAAVRSAACGRARCQRRSQWYDTTPPLAVAGATHAHRVPPALCARASVLQGLGAAAELSVQEMDRDHEWISYLSNRLSRGITERIPDVVLNGDSEQRYIGNLNYSFAYVEGESLLMALKNIAVSSGSACTSASLEPSYVLRAIGVEEDLAHTSIRFGIGRFTTEDEVDMAVELCARHVNRLREMSPLWEMVQEGIDIKSIKWTQEH